MTKYFCALISKRTIIIPYFYNTVLIISNLGGKIILVFLWPPPGKRIYPYVFTFNLVFFSIINPFLVREVVPRGFCRTIQNLGPLMIKERMWPFWVPKIFFFLLRICFYFLSCSFFLSSPLILFFFTFN